MILFDRPAPTIHKIARLQEQATTALAGLKDANEIEGIGIRFYFPENSAITGDDIDAFLMSYDPDQLTVQEQLDVVSASGNAAVASIPGWATWTEQETLDYIASNVTDLPSAVTVLEAMARMLVALRNRQWPNLEGS